MTRTCEHCGEAFSKPVRAGRTPRFCTSRCRVAASRARRVRESSPVPMGMRSRARWVRCDARKRPVSASGVPMSWNRPDAWGKYSVVSKADYGVGNGFVLGDGIGVIDLDHCIAEDGSLSLLAENVLRRNPGAYVEVSQSGRGLHVFGMLPDVSMRLDGYEVYGGEAKRFVWVTGNCFRPGALPPLVV